MYYKYGTAGFRCKSELLKDISIKIGEVLAILCYNKNKKYIGVMVTASHNKYDDNGIKIVNYDGKMINKEDEEIVTSYINGKMKISKNRLKTNIVIGMDTRESSNEIRKLIIKGINNIDICSNIINLNLITTPIIHYEVWKRNNNETNKYLNFYYENVNFKKLKNIIENTLIDCANGVSYIWIKKLESYIKINSEEEIKFNLINTDIDNYKKLNNECGSDFVCNKKILNKDQNEFRDLMVSFDGDGDRIVFYYVKEGELKLLNGDKISSLIIKYLINILKDEKIKKEVKINIVYTGYSNGNFIKYIKSLENIPNIKLNLICTATGVKNLHKEAEKGDIGIYFEANGHGTLLFNKNIHNKKINNFSKIFNNLVGDSISNLIGIFYIINELKITKEEWYNLYEEKENKIRNIEVIDKEIFYTNDDETMLIEPKLVQEFIDYLMEKYKENDLFCFIRPSGTENKLRIYIEGNNLDFDFILNEIEKSIRSNE